MTISNNQLKAGNSTISIPDTFGVLNYEVRKNRTETPIEAIEGMNEEIQELYHNLQVDGADVKYLNDFQSIINQGANYHDDTNMHPKVNGEMNAAIALSQYVNYDKSLNPDKRKYNDARFSRINSLGDVQSSYLDAKQADNINNYEQTMLDNLSGRLDSVEHENLIPSVFNTMSKFMDRSLSDKDARLLYDCTYPYLKKASRLGINRGVNYIQHPDKIIDSVNQYYARTTDQERQKMDHLAFERSDHKIQPVFQNGHSVYEQAVNDMLAHHKSGYIRQLSREMEDYNPVRNLSNQLEEVMHHGKAQLANYRDANDNYLKDGIADPNYDVISGNNTYEVSSEGRIKKGKDTAENYKHYKYYSFLKLNDKLYRDGKHNPAMLNRVKNYLEHGYDNSKEKDASANLDKLLLEDNAILPSNVDLQDALRSYLSRENGATFKNMVADGRLRGLTDLEVRRFESGVRYLQNNNLSYNLSTNSDHQLTAEVPTHQTTLTLTGPYAGSVNKRINGNLMKYNKGGVSPVKLVYDPRYKNTREVQDNRHYLQENSIPFQFVDVSKADQKTQDTYRAVVHESGRPSFVMFGGDPDQNQNKVLSVGYDPNRLGSLLIDSDAMDVACGICAPVNGDLSTEAGAHAFSPNFSKNGATYTLQTRSYVNGYERALSSGDQKSAQKELTNALNDARIMAFNDEIKRVFNSNPHNRKLLYAATNVNRFVKDEDGMDQNIKDNIQDTLDQLNPTEKSAQDAVDVFTKLYSEDVANGYDEGRLNQALQKLVNDGDYDVQAVINLKHMYELTAKYIDDHVGKSINYFDPQYVKAAITNSTTESIDYTVKLMKDAGISGANLFTHGDQIALNRTIDNLISYDEKTGKTADELREHHHDFEKETRDGYEAYLSRRFNKATLPILRTDILKQAGINVPENADVKALYQVAAENDPQKLFDARTALVDQEFKRIQALDKKFADDVDLTQVDQINTQDTRELMAYRELKSILTDRAADVDNDLADQLDFIQGFLKKQGISDVNVKIDDNGVVEWKGDFDKTFVKNKAKGTPTRHHLSFPMRGEIGQIYGRDANGIMQLKFASGDQRFKSAGNVTYYSFDGADREERFRLKTANDIRREFIQSKLNSQVGKLACLASNSITDFGYSILQDSYFRKYPNGTKEEFKKMINDPKSLYGQANKQLKMGELRPDGVYEMYHNVTIKNSNGKDIVQDFKPLLIRMLNNGSRNDVIDLSDASSVTQMSQLYSKEMYGQEINPRVLAEAHRPESCYQDDNISKDMYIARVDELRHKSLYDNNFAKAAGATSLSPDMPHSTYESIEARLAGRQMLGESQVADSAWADDDATGSGANQGRQQTAQMNVLAKTEKRRINNILEQNALIKPADGEQNKLHSEDRHDVKGYDDADGRSPLRTEAGKEGLLKYVSHDAADRRNMFYKNLESSTNDGRVNIAMMTFGGFTAEDSIVISKKTAEYMKIIGADGERRPLRAGDKLSDAHGNKGVISLVVDPEMSDEEAKRLGLEDEVKFFRDNPNVDVVGDPESVMSRANMGVALEAGDNQVGKVKGMNVDIGRRFMLVTDKAADKDAHVAGENESGRSQGGLFQAALIEADCPELSKQLIGDRNQGFDKLADLAEGLGYRLTKNGGLITEDTARKCDDDDHDVKVYDLDQEFDKAYQRLKNHQSLTGTYFSAIKGQDGSMILKPNANKLLADAAQHKHVEIKLPRVGVDLKPDEQNRTISGMLTPERMKIKAYDPKTNKFGKETDTIKIVPVSEREARDLDTGMSSGLTKMYAKAINSAWNARQASINVLDQAKQEVDTVINHPESLTPNQQKSLKKMTLNEQLKFAINRPKVRSYSKRIPRYSKNTQSQYQSAQREVQRQLGGVGNEEDNSKQKAMRNHILKPSEPNSGTLTAHADPRLTIDEVMIPEKLANKMNMKDGSIALLQRDPIQKVGNIRTINIRVNNDPDFQGIAMNPVIVKSFDGDFDGDKYGVTKIDVDPKNEALMNEIESLRPHNNLIDRCYKPEDADKNKYGEFSREAGVMLNLSVEETAGMIAAVEKYQASGENVLADSTLFDPKEYLEMRDAKISEYNNEVAAYNANLQQGQEPKESVTPVNENDGLTQETVSDSTKQQASKDHHNVAKALGVFTVADYVEHKVKMKAQSIEKMPMEQRERQADNLSRELQGLEHANFGAIRLNCENEQTVESSLVRMVETGAKGSMGKVENDMHYYHGFDNQPQGEHSVLKYNYDAQGNKLRPLNEREAQKMSEERLYQDETHKAMRIKTDFTAIAGAVEQRLLASAMSINPRECSEIAAGFYQDLLQAKHDPDDALRRIKHTQDLGKMLGGADPETGRHYKDLSKFQNDMRELVIGQAHCKVGASTLDNLCEKMMTTDRMGRPYAQSIENTFADHKNAYAEFMFGHGTKTLMEMAKSTEEAVPESRRHSLGAYQTFVKDRIGDKAVKEGNQTVEIAINNLIPSDYQPHEDTIEQAYQTRDVRVNEPVQSHDMERENVNEDPMGINHEHDHEMSSMDAD